MASPPSPPPHQQPPTSDYGEPPLGIPLLLPAPPPSNPSSRRLPPPCWTPEETSALIDAYCNKWYSLRRGNLRAAHWQDVADDIHRACPHVSPPKTAVQCRHKMEKLRKRYRAELQRAKSIPHHRFSSAWIYFAKMDSMEKGDSAAPGGGGGGGGKVSTSVVTVADDMMNDGFDDDDDEDVNEDLDDEDYNGGSFRKEMKEFQRNNGLRIRIANNSRKNYGEFIENPNPNHNPWLVSKSVMSSRYSELRSPPSQLDEGVKYSARFVKNGSNGGVGSSSGMGLGVNLNVNMKKKRSALGKREMRGREKGDDVALAMVEAIRLLGEGFERTEMTKIEMMRDAEKARMEIELNRTKMILQCQLNMVEAFVKGWSDHFVNNNGDDDNKNDDRNAS